MSAPVTSLRSEVWWQDMLRSCERLMVQRGGLVDGPCGPQPDVSKLPQGLLELHAELVELGQVLDFEPWPSEMGHPEEGSSCDVCQCRQALVTIGCVDYCALCAPEAWGDE